MRGSANLSVSLVSAMGNIESAGWKYLLEERPEGLIGQEEEKGCIEAAETRNPGLEYKALCCHFVYIFCLFVFDRLGLSSEFTACELCASTGELNWHRVLSMLH